MPISKTQVLKLSAAGNLLAEAREKLIEAAQLIREADIEDLDYIITGKEGLEALDTLRNQVDNVLLWEARAG